MGIDLALRASLVWNGEVMNDVVLDRPAPITIGATGKTTFVAPDIGIAELAIIRPGSAGYLVTLSDRMGGTICLGGQQHQVADLVAGQRFHATSIAIGDWGVIDLDPEGLSQLFFQFVPREERAEIVTRQQLNIGVGGFGLFSMIGAAIFAVKGLDAGEALFRSVALTSLIFAAAALAHAVMKQDNNSKASLAFSIILHTAILSFTFHVYSTESAEAALPTPRELTAQYLVSRPDPQPTLVSIAKALPTLAPTSPAAAPPTDPLVAPKPTGGGDGDTPKPRANAGGRGIKAPATVPSQFGVLGNPDLHAIVARNVGQGVGQLAGVNGPRGTGPAGPPGPNRTTKGNGKDPKAPAGEHKEGEEVGPIKVRGAVCIGSCGGGAGEITIAPPPTVRDDEPTISAKEIDEVVRRKAGMFRACYQKEVNRLPELSGSIVMRFVIGADGGVRSAKRVGGTLRHEGVTSCMELNVGQLRFPAKGGATVTYPFVFSLGG